MTSAPRAQARGAEVNRRDTLPLEHFLKVDQKAGELAESPLTLGEPKSKYLGDGVRELRFTLGTGHVRLTYWLTDRRSVVLLTWFYKTQRREDTQVQRARDAKKVCEAERGPAHEDYEREGDA
ncbi:type II toxin-antitoxin system RelE/ParE family toxin [Streptomyces yerevanensis]|uniref:type II toxin-antitoxin system RelE/ParE family toxin n=1 Tax=Streptomyces yerevanensis TaxID=66378 RepID=UPI00069105B0|nr:type II toxin-antitoxin system RelE/ParE family toxin [Streptomyces yerevanensis]